MWTIKTQPTVGNDDRVFPLDRLISNSLCQVNSQQDRVHLPADRVERCLKQDCRADCKLRGASLAIIESCRTYGQCCRSSCPPKLQGSCEVSVSIAVGSRLADRDLLSTAACRIVQWIYSQLPHGGNDSPGVGRRSGLRAHCIGCESNGCLEHKVIQRM